MYLYTDVYLFLIIVIDWKVYSYTKYLNLMLSSKK